MKKYQKILTIMLVTVFGLLSISPIFAATISVPPVDSNYNHYVIYYDTNVGTRAYLVKGTNYTSSTGTSVTLSNYKEYKAVGDSWEYQSTNTGGYNVRLDGIKYNSFDIKSTDGTQVFFSVNLVPKPAVWLRFQTPHQLIAPALVTLVVGSVVSLVAFRKAWSFLVRQLRGA